LNAFPPIIRSSAIAALAAVLLLSACRLPAAIAGAPEFVGVLAIALEDSVAKDLKLSAEQQAKLLDFVDARENEAVDLALQLKDLSPSEREAKLAPFRRESEAQGLALLTKEQRAQLEKIRLGRLGLVALSEPAIAEQLILSDEKQKEVAALVKERGEKLATADERSSQFIRAEWERKLAALLTQQQRTAWEKLSGSEAPQSSPAKTETAKAVAAEGKEAAEPPKTPDDEMLLGLDELLEEPAGPAEKLAETPAEKPAEKQARLRFNFRYTPWKDVIEWFAQQADLSLNTEKYPPGTFNYSDTREYTPTQAIDILNSVLLTKNFTLVRQQGRAVTLIDLQDFKEGIPPYLVSQVTPEDLDGRGNSEFCSVEFPCDRLTPEKAAAEIKLLLGPQESVITLPESRQIRVTGTAAHLRAIREVIRRIEDPDQRDSAPLQTFALQYITAVEALGVMRQFLDIPENGFAAPDGSIRFAVDPTGKRLLAAGKPAKLARVKEILKEIDVQRPGQTDISAIEESPQLQSYSVTMADLQQVLAVLQTLLAGLPDVRLTADAKTSSIIALARPAQHKIIRATIEELDDSKSRPIMEVIRLRVVDAQQAVLAINKLFGSGGDGAKAPVNPNAPQVDANPETKQLLIRGTVAQIGQIRSLLEKMGEPDPSSQLAVSAPETSKLRVLSALKGRAGISALERAREIWPSLRANRIRVVSPSGSGIPEVRMTEPEEQPEGPARPPEKEKKEAPAGKLPVTPAAPEPPSADKSAALPASPIPAPTGFFLLAQLTGPARTKEAVADNPPTIPRTPAAANGADVDDESAVPEEPETAKAPDRQPKEPAPIVVVPGPNGLMIASEDVEALNQFEKLLEEIAKNSNGGGPEITIFYLKHAKATVVAETLDHVFGGGTMPAGSSPGGGGLLGGLAGAALGDSGGGILGSLLGLGEGGTIAPTGSIKITPDTRLNALVVQANATDAATIEQLLKILDQKESPEEIAIVPKAKIIPLKNTQAEEVVTILQEVYRERMAAAAGQGGAQPTPQQLMQQMVGGMMGGGRRGGRGGAGPGGQRGNQEEQQKMTVGVDTRTNSVVLAAPEPLFTEVSQLIEQIDQMALRSNQTMQIVTLHRASSDTVQQALGAIVGDGVQFGRSNMGSRMMRGNTRRPMQTQMGYQPQGNRAMGAGLRGQGGQMAQGGQYMQQGGMQGLRGAQGYGAQGSPGGTRGYGSTSGAYGTQGGMRGGTMGGLGGTMGGLGGTMGGMGGTMGGTRGGMGGTMGGTGGTGGTMGGQPGMGGYRPGG